MQRGEATANEALPTLVLDDAVQPERCGAEGGDMTSRVEVADHVDYYIIR